MNYELAKRLKEAGFPFNPNRKWELSDYYFEPTIDTTKAQRDKVWIPTLSELIEACGYNLHLLEKEPNTSDYWRCLTIVEGEQLRTKGLTPEEAVAKLWIGLNEKKI